MLLDLLVERISLKDVWRSVMEENGRVFAVMAGTTRRQVWSAGRLDSLEV